MIKKNLFKIILSSVFTLIPIPSGLFLKSRIPEANIPLFLILLIPLLIFAINLLCIFITLFDNSKNAQSGKILNITFYIMPFISLFASAITYVTLLGADEKILMLFTNLFLAAVLLVIGNYLPKCRQNHTIGVRIPWTLGSEENWSMTHRFAGKCSVIAGIISTVCAFLPIWAFFINFVCILIFVALLPTLYSYLYHKKHKTEKKEVMSKKAATVSVIAGVSILIVLIAVCFTGNVDVEFNENSFVVKADYWKDLELDFGEIETVEYREDFDAGLRVMGFGSPRLSIGNFRNDEFSSYNIFSYTKAPAHVVITSNGKTIVIGLKTSNETRVFYESLIEKSGK